MTRCVARKDPFKGSVKRSGTESRRSKGPQTAKDLDWMAKRQLFVRTPKEEDQCTEPRGDEGQDFRAVKEEEAEELAEPCTKWRWP